MPSVNSDRQVWKTMTVAPYSFTARFNRCAWVGLLFATALNEFAEQPDVVLCWESSQAVFVWWKLVRQEIDRPLIKGMLFWPFTSTWIGGTRERTGENWTAVRENTGGMYTRDNAMRLNKEGTTSAVLRTDIAQCKRLLKNSLAAWNNKLFIQVQHFRTNNVYNFCLLHDVISGT